MDVCRAAAWGPWYVMADHGALLEAENTFLRTRDKFQDVIGSAPIRKQVVLGAGEVAQRSA